MGDHQGMAETRVLQGTQGVPRLAGEVPAAVVVCSPAQLTRAREWVFAWGRPVPIVWAVHNGHERELAAGWEGPLLTFSLNNLGSHGIPSREHAYMIRPAFVPLRSTRETLRDGPLFTMCNRPGTRRGTEAVAARARLREAVARASVRMDVYGQDQALGYLDLEERHWLFASSRGYVSCLPNDAGFGLAEHEALEAGCPLAAMAWGDTPMTLAGYPGLCRSASALEANLEALAGSSAQEQARYAIAGWDLLAQHYSPAVRDQTIQAFLDGLL